MGQVQSRQEQPASGPSSTQQSTEDMVVSSAFVNRRDQVEFQVATEIYQVDRELRDFPEHLLNQYTKFINLNKNKLQSLPDTLVKCRKLKRLSVSSNNITDIPEWISYLQMLEFFDVTHNPIKGLPSSIGQLQNLTSLGLSNCGLDEIPTCVYSLQQLEKLGLFSNKIKSISSDISNLRQLVKLDLSHNELSSLPEEFGALYRLQWLNLSYNKLRELPQSFSRLTNMIDLGLCCNELASLPDLSKLQLLKVLPVYNNQLTCIGSWLPKLASLQKFDASNNQLVNADEVFHLPNVNYINLKKNRIQAMSLPVSFIQNLEKSLQFLDLSSNRLRYLPFNLKRVESIKSFRFGPQQDCGQERGKIMSLRLLCSDSLIKQLPFDNWQLLLNYLPYEVQRDIECHAQVCTVCERPFINNQNELRETLSFAGEMDVQFGEALCSATCKDSFQQTLNSSSNSSPILNLLSYVWSRT
ncbi:hypothetical protein MP228_007325 [Amoeboaphelidium protococcarum]|nr:hypothetical protein MP228_007325 [Amoeboaphelidium protococcarum]